MKFSASDLPDIKWNLLALILSALFAFALINYAIGYQQQAALDLNSAQQQLTDARKQLISAKNDAENMATYQLEYEALETQKVIGNEQRLDWIENLEKIRKKKLVLDFKYTIGPQQAYVPNPPLDTGGFALNISPMSLQIELLHEEQLQRLFTAFQNEMQGWFILERCTLSGGNTSQDPTAPLKAECSGGWITLKK
ncbi:MAG: hypothetical protein PHP57_10230 [Sideroxydans sp.]|nr:hypothetical protein [Sideroxydans sp.]